MNLALLGPWVGPDVGTLWFVEILVYFHVAYGLALSATRGAGRAWSLPLLMGAVTVALLLTALATGLHPDDRVALYLPAFAAGAAVGGVLGDRGAGGGSKGRLGWSAASVILLFLVMALLPVSAGTTTAGARLVVAAATLLLCGILLVRGRSRSDPPAGKATLLVRELALASFMAYLVHRIVYRFAADAAVSLGLEPGVAVVASIPVVLALSVLLQRAYDVGTCRLRGGSRGRSSR